jgi:hypothetical protein
MDYSRIYIELIERAADRVIEGYTEKHHVVPKCMGGDDKPHNLVALTPEEHFLAHQLLVKIYPKNNKLVYAANMMGATRKGNKVYGWLRRKHALAVSKTHKGKIVSDETRILLSESRKGKTSSEETKQKISLAKKGKPLGKNSKRVSSESCALISVSKMGNKCRLGINGRLDGKPMKGCKGINQYSKDNEFIAYYATQSEAARAFNLDSRRISDACKGIIKTAGGFIWCFDDNKA